MEHFKTFIYVITLGIAFCGMLWFMDLCFEHTEESEEAFQNIEKYYDVTDIRYYTKIIKSGYGSREKEYIDVCYKKDGKVEVATFSIPDSNRIRIDEREKTEMGVDSWGRYVLFISQENYNALLGFQSVDSSQIETEGE